VLFVNAREKDVKQAERRRKSRGRMPQYKKA